MTLILEGSLGCFKGCILLCELSQEFSILEERSVVRSDEAIVGLIVIGWDPWFVHNYFHFPQNNTLIFPQYTLGLYSKIPSLFNFIHSIL